MLSMFFFFNDTATTEIYTLSLHDALPICLPGRPPAQRKAGKLPSRTKSWRRPLFLSASLADARFLGIPHRQHGIGTDSVDLSCPLHQVSGKSWVENYHGRQSLGIPGRWRDG